MSDETIKQQIIADRYAGLKIPPIFFLYEMAISRDTTFKGEICGQFGPGTADRLERLFAEIVSIARDVEHPALPPEPDPVSSPQI